MQKLTHTELNWIIGELDRAAAHLKNTASNRESDSMSRGLCNLRADNLAAISDKLAIAVKNGDKRIEVQQ